MSGKTVYQEITKTTDHETGETKTTTDRKVVKKNSTPDFIMLFTQSAPMLAEARLTAAQSQILFEILSNYVARNNLCIINAATKEEISSKHGLKYDTVDTNMRVLVAKEILVKDKKENGRGSHYYLNPHIFGKGSWQDIESLRYEIAAEYNFKTLEFTKKETVGASTGLIAAASKPHEVTSRSSHIDDHGVEHEEVVIQESNNYGNTTVLPLFEDAEVVAHNSSELDMLREQNRAKELAIEEMKFKIKMHELGM